MNGTDSINPLDVLGNPQATLGQVQRALDALEKSGRSAPQSSIGLSSNITIELLGVYLRKEAWRNGVHLRVVQGNFDDPMGDIDRFQAEGVEQMLLLPFFDNILPSFEAQISHLPAEILSDLESEFRARYRLVFRQAAAFKTLFLAGMHRFGSCAGLGGDRVDEVVVRFNQILMEEAASYSNIRWIPAETSVQRVGQIHAFDPRFYYGAKAPYSTLFFQDFARRMAACSRGFGAHFHKVLVLDCDNTLWGGVIGEDLLPGIKLDPFDHPGNIFWRVQHELVTMENHGVLMCLCSKNNPQDVSEVFARHPHMVLKEDHLAVKKVNWRDKADNLREIAAELNLGLDSMALLDDSSFECESVRAQLPMVRTFQVPSKLSGYPALMQEVKELFLAGGTSNESRSTTSHYRQRAKAEEMKADFQNQEEYLLSLGMKVILTRDVRNQVRRISELSLKSNQFNLTTRRYTEADIQRLMESPDATVYALNVSDRFGDAGLTGVLVMRWEGASAHVDSFFMSCRIIGRGVEDVVWEPMLEDAVTKGCRSLCAEYIPTAKNVQVAFFFNGLGLSQVEETQDGTRRYHAHISELLPPKKPWIEVVNGG